MTSPSRLIINIFYTLAQWESKVKDLFQSPSGTDIGAETGSFARQHATFKKLTEELIKKCDDMANDINKSSEKL